MPLEWVEGIDIVVISGMKLDRTTRSQIWTESPMDEIKLSEFLP